MKLIPHAHGGLSTSNVRDPWLLSTIERAPALELGRLGSMPIPSYFSVMSHWQQACLPSLGFIISKMGIRTTVLQNSEEDQKRYV